MGDGNWGSDDGIPLGELTDEEVARPVRSTRSSRRSGALGLAIVVVAAGVAIAVHVASGDDGARRRVAPAPKPHVGVTTINDPQARADVLRALSKTTASGSFNIHFRLSETPAPVTTSTSAARPCPGDTFTPGAVRLPTAGGFSICVQDPGPHNVTIAGTGTVIVDPTAMVTISDVPGFGRITTRVDGTNVWETGGGNYGTMPPATSGAPLSGFAGLVLGTLGPREGAVAMSNMASPTGYLDLAEQAITAASQIADSVVDGVAVHVYEVSIDTSGVVDRPGLTAEEIKARTDARAVLRDAGYRTTTIRLSIDASGFIRRAQTTVRFADGGAVDGDTTFSDFGCSSVTIGPDGPSINLDPAGCTDDAPPSTP